VVEPADGWRGYVPTREAFAHGGYEARLGGGTSMINGVVYRNYFDAFNDPAKFGLFYHAALLLRRGDVRPGKKCVAVRIAEDMDAWMLKRAGDIPALRLVEKHRLGLALPGESLDADTVVAVDDVAELEGDEVRSDTGELWRSWSKRIGWIDTPRTKAAYGFLGEAGLIALQGLQLSVQTPFAVIALSSLTDDPIAGSDSLLLTAVGRCENSAVEYNEDRTRQLNYGRAPTLIEAIEAQVGMATVHPDLKVWVISDKGEAATRLATEYKDGVLRFEIGPQPRWSPSTMVYLIKV
jgi:hypothetical protein